VSRTPAAALVAGAVTSAGCFLWVARENQSPLLLVLFVGWVLLPFVTLGLADAWARRKALPVQLILRFHAVALTVASLAIYLPQVLWPAPKPRVQLFVLAPALSTLLVAVVCVGAVVAVRGRSPNN